MQKSTINPKQSTKYIIGRKNKSKQKKFCRVRRRRKVKTGREHRQEKNEVRKKKGAKGSVLLFRCGAHKRLE